MAGAEVWVKLVEPGAGNGGGGIRESAIGIRDSAIGIREEASASTNGSFPPNAEPRIPNPDSALSRSLGDPATFRFLTLTTRPTVRTDSPSPGGRTGAADGGKTAVYMLRWVNTRGEKGPWSEVATATIAA